MAALPYMQLYVADYLADTMHLTTEEHGAYLLLIFNYWQTGKPIPKTRLSRIARVQADRWKDVEGALSEFFEDDGEQWIHLRIERDIETVTTKPRGKALPGGDSLTGYKGYVYFVTEPDSNLVKVGYSKNPWARLSELRRSHGVALSVVATIKTVEKSETPVHSALTEFHAEGEWFHKTDAVKGLIEAISGGVVTTVVELRNYVDNYGSPTTATTNKDTDTDIPPPLLRAHDFDARNRFAMTADWQTCVDTFPAVLLGQGLTTAMFTEQYASDLFTEFRSFWVASPDEHRTQAKWEHALASHMKRNLRTLQANGRASDGNDRSQQTAQGQTGRGSQAGSGQRNGRKGAGSAVDQVKNAIAERDARDAEREAPPVDAGQTLGEDDGDLRSSLDGEFWRVG